MVSELEHGSVYDFAELPLEWPVAVCRARPDGTPDLDHLQDLVAAQRSLVSMMHVNNETGVIFPVAAIAEITHRHGGSLHVDAAQSVGKMPLDEVLEEADALTLSAHKFHGPLGVGAIALLDAGFRLAPVLPGRRPGGRHPQRHRQRAGDRRGGGRARRGGHHPGAGPRFARPARSLSRRTGASLPDGGALDAAPVDHLLCLLPGPAAGRSDRGPVGPRRPCRHRGGLRLRARQIAGIAQHGHRASVQSGRHTNQLCLRTPAAALERFIEVFPEAYAAAMEKSPYR